MRLIDADKFEDALENTEYDISPAYEPDGYSHKLICEVLDETPTVDAVPVVRCGECRFSRGVRPDDGAYPDCIMCENEDMHVTIPAPVYVTDFCSYGEMIATND